jgi:NADPH-dependent glutamate synthase beta subunit-like oxidoreductase
MEQEGVKFVTGVSVGQPGAVSLAELRAQYDAVLLACGATAARDLMTTPGRQLQGIHQAMEFLTSSTRALLATDDGRPRPTIDAKGRHVVVIGGGDTGTDCIGTSLRQGCASVSNLEILPRPLNDRAEDNPWPQWPRVYKVDYGHEEAAATGVSATGANQDPRTHLISTKAFIADEETGTRVVGVKTVQVQWDKDASGRWVMSEVAGSERVLKADLVLLAMGFLGPERSVVESLPADAQLELDARGNFKAAYGAFHTTVPGVFAAGDCRRGQSLIVWAINGIFSSSLALPLATCDGDRRLTLDGGHRGTRRGGGDRPTLDGRQDCAARRGAKQEVLLTSFTITN